MPPVRYPIRPTKEELTTVYHKDKLSVREIAKIQGIPPPTLFQWFKDMGIKLRSRRESGKLVFQNHPERVNRARINAIKRQTGKKQTPEWIAHRMAHKIGSHQSPETIAKRLKTRTERGNLKWTPDQREKLLPGFLKRTKVRPTSLEKIFNSLIIKYDLPYKYVGDGYTWIVGRCPDYLNINGKKEVIEVFSRWWHDPKVNPRTKPQHTEEATIAHYKKYGFKCIVIWEEELKHENKVLDMIGYIKGDME
jgi:G:T-mismatch repair DNA endonuclease (very short patch repair protein)